MSKATPEHGVAYPLRIGKTLRDGIEKTLRHSSRSLLALKFTHVPNNTLLTASGSLTRNADKCTVSIPTHDGNAVSFTGSRTNNTAVAEYSLVFANGAMWLERADDVFPGMRPSMSERVPVPATVPDDITGDPDSWMVEESGSPITPEGLEGEEDRMDPRPRAAGKSVAAKTVVASKGLLPNGNNNRREASSSEDDDDDDSDNNSDSDDSGSESSQEYTDRSSDEED